MAKTGPIIIAEDDPDDQEILKEIFQNLNVHNELKFFENGQKVLEYLLSTIDKPFLIISDVNLLGMSGFELKQKINANPYLRAKSIPFIFLTTSLDNSILLKTYEMMAQGYFQKGDSLSQIQDMIKLVIDYWLLCKHPNNE
jgi:CheY-like chemotaxis protein